MNRSKIKKEARVNLKRNYFRNILIIFIAGLVINGGYNYNTNILPRYTPHIEENLISNIYKLSGLDNPDKKGVIAPLIDNITKNKSISVGLISTINNIIFKDGLSIKVVSISALLLAILFYIFVRSVLKVGRDRYFLEQRRYKNTKIDKLFFPYQTKRAIHISYILFIRTIYQLLWSLTIIGGIIKYYEYFFIPYVLAENPDINKKDAFILSRELSNGYKMELFKLDLSLIGWYILHIITLGFSSLFYFDAYKECIYAEIYMNIRKNQKKNLTYKKLLNDKYLDINSIENKSYPKDKYLVPIERNFLKIDYRKKYSIGDYVLFFFTLAIFGWVWEVILQFIMDGMFVNRGTMHGPWLPIYGYGCVFVLLLLSPYRDKPVLSFFLTMLIAGSLEYLTALYLELVNGLSWWSYEGYFMNLHGRVCLEGLLVFGFMGAAVIYLVAPIMKNIYAKINYKVKVLLCMVLLISYGIDFVYSTYNPNTGKGITTEIVK